MRALIVTTGSRGDVQPFVALARALTREGHGAVVAAPRRFAPLASRHGTDFLPMDEGVLALQDDLAHRGTLAALTSARAVGPLMRAWLDDVARLSDADCDVVVHAPKALGAADLADLLGVPSIAVLTLPLYTPTAEFASPLVPVLVPRFLHRPSWRLAAAVEAPYRGLLRHWRSEELGLHGRPASLSERIAAGGALHIWSRHLVPSPADWPPDAAPSGALLLPSEDGWTPPDELARLATVVESARELWREPDEGMWEVRTDPRHWTSSKVYAWVCLDRAVQLAEMTGGEDEVPLEAWREEARAIRRDVLDHGYDPSTGSFVQSYG
ncbi:glycoside hydrolase family 15 protein, partial [Nocardiopsis tropica]|nr:glycoside hydrolase family 15 protein [Nocardiopsis tropica]